MQAGVDWVGDSEVVERFFVHRTTNNHVRRVPAADMLASRYMVVVPPAKTKQFSPYKVSLFFFASLPPTLRLYAVQRSILLSSTDGNTQIERQLIHSSSAHLHRSCDLLLINIDKKL